MGAGFHLRPGELHAEAAALRNLKSSARGGTAYVNLEPCSHFGRTPPCSDALVSAGIKRVVISGVDPDKRVSGNGIKVLKSNGIHVEVGLLAEQSALLNAAYLKQRAKLLPWVVLKTAMSADGKIATSTGESRWISGRMSRLYTHRQLRNRCDAILCGVGTVLRDDPSLTTRLTSQSGRNPWRFILDTHLRTPLNSKCVLQAAVDHKTLIFCGDATDSAEFERTAVGCTIIKVKRDPSGRVSIPDVLEYAGTRGDILSVLVEGGPSVLAGMIRANAVDRWINFTAPIIIGGQDAPSVFNDIGVAAIRDTVQVVFRRVRRSGPDIVIDTVVG